MYLNPIPLAYAFPAMPSPAIPDEDVVDAAPLNQGPLLGKRADKKREVWPQPEPIVKTNRQKVGMPLPKKQKPIASG
jgi:hypothetical protein